MYILPNEMPISYVADRLRCSECRSKTIETKPDAWEYPRTEDQWPETGPLPRETRKALVEVCGRDHYISVRLDLPILALASRGISKECLAVSADGEEFSLV